MYDVYFLNIKKTKKTWGILCRSKYPDVTINLKGHASKDNVTIIGVGIEAGNAGHNGGQNKSGSTSITSGKHGNVHCVDDNAHNVHTLFFIV